MSLISIWVCEFESVSLKVSLMFFSMVRMWESCVRLFNYAFQMFLLVVLWVLQDQLRRGLSVDNLTQDPSREAFASLIYEISKLSSNHGFIEEAIG
jgi:hypothetical protein